MLQRQARAISGTARTGCTALSRPTLPRYASFGLALLLLAWSVSWSAVKPFSTFSFFPLWLGYILLVDGIVAVRRGTSLLSEGKGPFLRLFLVSAFFWWGFEALNLVVHNWQYVGVASFSRPAYVLFSSLAFSTVMPAVLETATLLASFFPRDRFLNPIHTPPPYGRLAVVMMVGLLTFAAPFVWPRQAYGLLWVSSLLVVEPINWVLGRPSTFRLLAENKVALILLLGGTGLVCGPLWEMWNFYAYPKWYYVLPGIAGPKFFEMPLAGMLGYPPYMLEVYAVYNLLLPLFGRYSAFERVLQAP